MPKPVAVTEKMNSVVKKQYNFWLDFYVGSNICSIKLEFMGSGLQVYRQYKLRACDINIILS